MQPRPKSLFASKTFWFNVLSSAVLVAQLFGYGEHALPHDWHVALTAVGNLILRLVTRQPVSLP